MHFYRKIIKLTVISHLKEIAFLVMMIPEINIVMINANICPVLKMESQGDDRILNFGFHLHFATYPPIDGIRPQELKMN